MSVLLHSTAMTTVSRTSEYIFDLCRLSNGMIAVYGSGEFAMYQPDGTTVCTYVDKSEQSVQLAEITMDAKQCLALVDT